MEKIKKKEKLTLLLSRLNVSSLFLNIILMPLNYYLRKKKLLLLGRDPSGIGDHLVMTSVIDFFYRKYEYRTIVITTEPSIFIHNPHVSRIIDYGKLGYLLQKFLFIFLYISQKDRIVFFKFHMINGLEFEAFMRNSQVKLHLREANLLHTKYVPEITDPKPPNKIYFSEEETLRFENLFSYLPENFALIQSQVKSSYTPVKDWGYENMQEVVNQTHDICHWVQIGDAQDPLLTHIKIDLRGRVALRELFYLFKKARLVVCNEGLYTHLSSAFHIPCITVYSGFHPWQISAYEHVIPVTRKPQMDCAYCWILGPCPRYETAKCIKDISVDQVVDVIKNLQNLK